MAEKQEQTPPPSESEHQSIPEKLFHLIGIHFPRGKEDKIHIRPRFFKTLGILGVVFLLSFLVLFKYSTSPNFCASCHIMKPYYDAWASSKHNKVPCVDCHYPPGSPRDVLWVKFQATAQVVKYVTRTYSSKPYAEIEDASCLRANCHDKRLLQGKVLTKVRGIIFDHRPHLLDLKRGKQLRCTSCHSQIVIGTHVEVTWTTCFICHFKGAKHGRVEEPIGGCPNCHRPPEKDFKIGNITFNHKNFVDAQGVSCQNCHLDAIQGEGEAPKERCFTCHNQPERIAHYNDTTFMHDNHVSKHKIECTHCHLEIKHLVRTQKPMDYDCSICHTKKHGAQKEIYMGITGKGVPDMPSPMYLANVDCIACHIAPKEKGLAETMAGQTYKAVEQGCLNCHGKKYLGMIDSWKSTIASSMQDLGPKIESAKKMLETSSGHPRWQEAQKLYQEAFYNYELVFFGKGVHNVYYSSRLLQVANENLDKMALFLGKPLPSLAKNSFLNGNYCAFLCHQQVGVKPPQLLKVQGLEFPHHRHGLEFGVGCTNCHSADKHKAMKPITRQTCIDCHHGKAAKGELRCVRCHSTQEGLYFGKLKVEGVKGASPNLMASVVNCEGCHDVTQRHTVANIAQKCVVCHDKAYADTLISWEAEARKLVAQAKEVIDRAASQINRAKQAKRNVKEAEALWQSAQNKLNLIAKGKGVHNLDLAEGVLKQATQEAQKALALLQPQAGK